MNTEQFLMLVSVLSMPLIPMGSYLIHKYG
jgi:hypothetical protein